MTLHPLKSTRTLLVAGALLLAACGDDASTETNAQYLTRVQAACPNEDPGFDPFMTAHPTPTAADYVTFLPTPIAVVQRSIDCIKGSKPPKDIKDEVQAVTKAMEVLRSDLNAALDDAKKGDLDGVNGHLGELNGAHIEAVNNAFNAVAAAAQG